MIIFVSSVTITDKTVLRKVIMPITASIALNEVFALIEIFTGKYFNLIEIKNIEHYSVYKNFLGLHVPIAYFGNPNNLGFFCLCSIAVIMVALALTKNRRTRLMLHILNAINVFIWICTESRMAYVCIVLYLALLLLFSLRKKTFAKYFIILAIVGSLVAIKFLGKIDYSTTYSDSIRMNLITNGLRTLFKESFGIGIGVGSIEGYMSQYSNTGGILNIHNWPIEILVSGGIVVFALAISFYVKFILDFYKLRYENRLAKDDALIVKVVLAFSLVFVIASMAPSTIITSDYHFVLFAIFVKIGSIFKGVYSKGTIVEEKISV